MLHAATKSSYATTKTQLSQVKKKKKKPKETPMALEMNAISWETDFKEKL